MKLDYKFSKFFIFFLTMLLIASFVNAEKYGDDDPGEFFAVLGFTCLVISYGRTMVKITVNKGGLFERLAPLDTDGKVKTFYDFFMKILNKTHPYVGAIAIISIFLHCYYTGSFLDNFLLRLVLVVMAWQGIFGLLIKTNFLPAKIRGKSYLIHSQFFTGILILILAGLGHLMIN